VVRNTAGDGYATVVFPNIPLLKGEYRITAFLACERGLHVYDTAPQCLTLDVTQTSILQGLVVLPHQWHTVRPQS
jgi:lipopolysaccharide transport system ATP-binding protein